MITPPTGLHPNTAVAWAYLAAVGGGTVLVLTHAVIDWRRTRSPMLWLLLLGGATVGPFAIEPTYDIVMATWYPADLPVHLATIAGRPMALMVPLMYISGISWICYLAFRMVMAGTAVRTMVITFATLSLLEGAGEMTASHFGIMRYYANHATILGAPLPSLVQNAGMFPLIAVVLAMLVPNLRGWRWVVVPFVPYVVYIGYVLAGTFPNVLAIQGQVSPPVSWTLAIASALLNGVVALAALYAPAAVALRQSRSQPVPSHPGATSAAYSTTSR